MSKLITFLSLINLFGIINSNNCDICKPTNYTAEDGNCVYTDHCAEVVPGMCFCQKCSGGYHLSLDERTCTPTSFCKKGKESGECELCYDGYYLDLDQNKCVSVGNTGDFLFCQKGNVTCEVCLSGYYLDENNKCTTSPHCKTSVNTICTECSEKYYLGLLDRKCNKDKHCTKSDPYFFCEECEKGYYYDPIIYKCVPEEDDEEGKFYDCKQKDRYSNRCAQCRSDFYLNITDHLCYSNKKEPYYKCSIVNYNECSDCISGYYFGTEDKKCSKVIGCKKSEDEDTCLECASYMCLNLKTKKCEYTNTIPEGNSGVCFHCKKTNKDGTACRECQNGYELGDNGLCRPEGSCLEENDEGVCTKCRRSTTEKLSSKSFCINKKFGCIESYSHGCLKCDNEHDFGSCSECDKGFRLYKNRFCFPCYEGCATCSTDDNCGSCMPGYFNKNFASASAYGADCYQCVEGCKSCLDETSCEECFEGYYLTNELSEKGGLQCAACSKGCSECIDNRTCLNCYDGYELVPKGDNKVICSPENSGDE